MHLARCKRWFLPALLIFPLLVILMREVRFRLLSDRERVAACVRSILAAARHREVGSMLGRVADDYQDRFHRDKQALQRTLRSMWFKYRKVEVEVLQGPTITIDSMRPDRARVRLRARVLLAARPQDPGRDILTSMRGTDVFCLRLRKVNGKWLVTGVTRQAGE